jgi:hypothetical protein
LKNNIISLLSLCAIFLGAIILVMELRSASTTSVEVEWVTASEINTVGFNLYRSQSSDGQYDQINDRMIPASPDPLIGGEYRYIDEGVEASLTYYYRLEEIDTVGNSTFFGPIEIQASNQNWQIMLLSGLLIVFGMMGLFYSNWRRRKTAVQLLVL